MSEAKHTPGPWKQEGHSVLIELEPHNLAECYGGTFANARLIASAPDLLEFAEEVRRTGDTRLASMAIALIAKATP